MSRDVRDAVLRGEMGVSDALLSVQYIDLA